VLLVAAVLAITQAVLALQDKATQAELAIQTILLTALAEAVAVREQ
jgi:hypothetical protein